jgi:hypothetical protein
VFFFFSFFFRLLLSFALNSMLFFYICMLNLIFIHLIVIFNNQMNKNHIRAHLSLIVSFFFFFNLIPSY